MSEKGTRVFGDPPERFPWSTAIELWGACIAVGVLLGIAYLVIQT